MTKNEKFVITAVLFLAAMFCTGCSLPSIKPKRSATSFTKRSTMSRSSSTFSFRKTEKLSDLPTLIFLDSGCWYSNGPETRLLRPIPGTVRPRIRRGQCRASKLAKSPSRPGRRCRAAVRFLRAHLEMDLTPIVLPRWGVPPGASFDDSRHLRCTFSL